MAINKDAFVKKNKDTICTNLDDEKIILNLKSNKYFSVNSSGTFIYELIPDKGITIEELDNKLKNKFEELNQSDIEEIHNFIECLSNAKICTLSY